MLFSNGTVPRANRSGAVPVVGAKTSAAGLLPTRTSALPSGVVLKLPRHHEHGARVWEILPSVDAVALDQHA